ncbi:unnamed protein product [Brassica rapa]|uniref:Uncharacterized protein n=2 Tax=Brassica TaxID=3705 RepID=A0A3P6AS30_BRACM|nr:unnamed protein product [Brassica napus]CAG7892517.1 unnamed protein product [Brassica rapa]CDY20793.1 BnaA02g09330D [Brassica napus]VDC86918.1 unnamed protein product [Brassica rapa]
MAVSTGVNNIMLEISIDTINKVKEDLSKSSQQLMTQHSQRTNSQKKIYKKKRQLEKTKSAKEKRIHSPSDVLSSQSQRSEDSANAFAAASRAWMSIEAKWNNNNKQTF